MEYYRSKYGQLPGVSLAEATKQARQQYRLIQKRSPRRVTYVRSKYFGKDKLFINLFWTHMSQKSPKERVKRIRLYACAIDLLRNTDQSPIVKQNPKQSNEVFYRFYGISKDGKKFCVQVKENKRSHQKHFVSVFLAEHKTQYK